MKRILTLLCLLSSICAFSQIDKSNFINHVNFLASDFLAGRQTGSFGAEIAAKYIASELNKYGVEPAGNDYTFYQYIPMHSAKLLPETKLTIFSENNFREYSINQDYLVHKIGELIFLSRNTEMVFAGFGIVAPEFDYNDYLNIDVRGKVVVILDGEPFSESADYFAGDRQTTYSSIETKQIIATARGAAALIVIPNTENFTDKKWQKMLANYQFEDISLAWGISKNLCLIFNPIIADFLFTDTEYDLNQIWQLAKLNKLHSFPLKTHLRFVPVMKRKDFVAVNVVGLIKGSDEKLRSTAVVVSAHYDHLGIGSPIDGDSIYNGLTDNAMGCAAVLEIARIISSQKIKPKRSIIFLFTTGEEQGLLGSTYYTFYPAFPLYRTILNLNVDGIAFLDKFRSVIAIGAEYLDLNDLLEKPLKKYNLYLSDLPSFALENSYVFSDNFAFAKAGVPALLIMEGIDFENLTENEAKDALKNYAENIYHTPHDDFKLQINYDAALLHSNFLLDFLLEVSNSSSPPTWKPNAPFYDNWLRNNAEKK